jgi:hypothetical protein
MHGAMVGSGRALAMSPFVLEIEIHSAYRNRQHMAMKALFGRQS